PALLFCTSAGPPKGDTSARPQTLPPPPEADPQNGQCPRRNPISEPVGDRKRSHQSHGGRTQTTRASARPERGPPVGPAARIPRPAPTHPRARREAGGGAVTSKTDQKVESVR